MLNVKTIPSNILKVLRENFNEANIAAMSAKEAFEYFLEWNGIIGYHDMFWDAVLSLERNESIEEVSLSGIVKSG